MSQRASGYARQAHDLYVTPKWVYEALYRFEPWAENAWDCAPINAKFDFLSQTCVRPNGIATNPPFNLATEFCRHAIECSPLVAMLLRCDFDHAATRQDLFGHSPHFAKKIALTKRIIWFERPGAAPSFNHAWFIWKTAGGPPMLVYAP